MAQSMLMSTSVNGGRALPSLQQAGRPARPMLPLRPSYYSHARSVSVRTMAIFGKSKAKTAPAKKVRGRNHTVLLRAHMHAHARHNYMLAANDFSEQST